MDILYIVIAVAAIGSLALSLLAMSNQAQEDQANEALLRLLQERTREMVKLREHLRVLQLMAPKDAATDNPLQEPTEEGGGGDDRPNNAV